MVSPSIYDPGQRCPGCSGRHWLIGARTAECAACGHAELLAVGARSATIMARRGKSWRPARYELGDTKRQPAVLSVIRSRIGGRAWQRGGFA